MGGGFNLLPPGNKTPITDYLIAQNWRVDEEGQLVSRYGWPLKFSIAATGAAHSAAIHGGILGDYYVATTTNELYILLAGVPTLIATGLSGHRVGMVPLLGWMWIMDRNVRGRHKAGLGALEAWNIAAPGSACTPAAGAGDPTGPDGTYQLYVTFVHDSAGAGDPEIESNPSPVSADVTVALQDIDLTAIATSADARVNRRNIYATGGTLGQPYRVGTIADNVTTILTITVDDGTAINDGIVMETRHDAPPAAYGMGGPYFGSLCAWNTSGHVNRFYWTDAEAPQYWPGAADEATGNWVDIGAEGENIIWCTFHPNCVIVYKERSIWRITGPLDPTSGTIEQLADGVGLVNPWAVTSGNELDYFVAPNGLYENNFDRVRDFSGNVRPLFSLNLTNTGATSPPGSILPGTTWFASPLPPGGGNAYSVALGYGMGKLYVSYAEKSSSTGYVLLVYNVAKQRWVYHRTAVSTVGIRGFLFDGVQMVGLTGSPVGTPAAYNLDDFRGFFVEDEGHLGIDSVYQSHFEDAGFPDNQKVWLEVAIDARISNGISAQVFAAFDNSATPVLVGAMAGDGTRKRWEFSLSLAAHIAGRPLPPEGTLATNISILVDVPGSNDAPNILYDVFLYYYVEARLALTASTLPIQPAGAQVIQAKELLLDIDASGGAVDVNVWSDLPNNVLRVAQSLVAPAAGGRGVVKLPFPVTEGYLWRVALQAAAAAFRLYSARMLVRPIGVYVEAYEAAAGFVWDSMEMSLDSGITHMPRGYAIALAALPIKRFREVTLEIDTFGGDVTLSFLTDLPGDGMAVRKTAVVNTGMAGRRFVRIPLPAGTAAPIEGRLCQIQLSGSAKFILYEAAIELLAVGVYLETYEAAGGAVWDSRELDFGTPAVKELREIELDLEADGPVTAQVIADVVTAGAIAPVTTVGRQVVVVPLTISAAAEQFVEGRLARLILSSTKAFRLYGARLKVRPFGEYMLAAEASAGALWDTGALDLGSQMVKQLRALELDLWAYGTVTITVYTDLPGNAQAVRVTRTVAATTGRTQVQIPLPQGGVPDNYIFGRLARVTIGGAQFKLFGARMHARPIGVYVETYEAAGGAVWDSNTTDLERPHDKSFDQVRIQMDSDDVSFLLVYTDLPGETFALRATIALTTGPSARHWATAVLPAGVEGRSVRLQVRSAAGYRIYRVQVQASKVGRYLAGPTPGATDTFNTLEYDFESERVKAVKRLEVDLRADQAVTLSVQTEQSGRVATVFTTVLLTPNGRTPIPVPLPPGIRGRLLRVVLSGGPARIYRLRAWMRPLNEPQAAWAWQNYPLEESEVLGHWADVAVPETPEQFAWADLPVKPTPPEWNWAPAPVNPTEPQWFWAKVLSVEETPDKWSWIDVPFEVQG